MRTPLLAVSLLALLATTRAGRAALYLPPAYGPFPVPAEIRYFKLAFADRKGLVVKPTPEALGKSSSLQQAHDEIKTLTARWKNGSITTEEGIRLSGYLLLVGQRSGEAIELLEMLKQREPNNFMILANLATAYLQHNLLDRALSTQERVLDPTVWPAEVPGWTPERLRWQRRVELHCLKLLQLRYNELLSEREPQMNRPIRLDNLFPGVRFVGRDGKYAAGEIDPRSMDRLPPDAVAIVKQLVLWLPQDRPLVWLLAELLNAHGDVRTAFELLTVLRDEGNRPEELEQHRRILARAVEALPPAEDRPAEDQGNRDKPAEDASGSSKNWLPDVKALSIGFGVGVLVGILGVLQLRQLRRRR